MNERKTLYGSIECDRQVYLNTFDFEAPEFYKKLGYEVIGALEGHKEIRYHFQKRLI